MAAIMKFSKDGITVEVPAISDFDLSRKYIADAAETAGGKSRQDMVRVKRVWSVKTLFLIPDEAAAIISFLESINYSAFDLWIDEFGPETNTIKARVRIDGEKRVAFGRGGVWYSNGKQLSLTIEEQ